MNTVLPIDKLSKLIKLRSLLDGISQISFSFSTLNRSYPIGTISSEMDADVLIQSYEDLIADAQILVSKKHLV